MAHIENGKDMITIDEAGHIFIWHYDKKYLKENNKFTPAYKYRISLNYLSLYMTKQVEVDPPNKNEDLKLIYNDALDYRHYISDNGHYRMLLPSKFPPS